MHLGLCVHHVPAVLRIVPIIRQFLCSESPKWAKKVCQLSVSANYQCANYLCSQCMVSLYPKHGAFKNVPIIRLCQLTVCQLSVFYCSINLNSPRPRIAHQEDSSLHNQEEEHMRAKEEEVLRLQERLCLLQSQVEASSSLQQEDIQVIKAKEAEVQRLQHKVSSSSPDWQLYSKCGFLCPDNVLPISASQLILLTVLVIISFIEFNLWSLITELLIAGAGTSVAELRQPRAGRVLVPGGVPHRLRTAQGQGRGAHHGSHQGTTIICY